MTHIPLSVEKPSEFVKKIKTETSPYIHNVELMVKPGTKPFIHQLKGYLIGMTLPNVGLFFDPGLGKTLTSIGIIGRRVANAEVNRVLIVAPLSVLAVWEEQFQEHAFFCFSYKVHVLDHKKVQNRIDIIEDLTRSRVNGRTAEEDNPLEVIVTNYDSLSKMEDAITKWKPDMIIADESQAIKNRKADRTKTMWRMGKLPSYKMILTGTPITESPIDFWAQYKFLDQNVFGKKFVKFRDQYVVMGGYGGFQVKKYKNLKQLSRQAYSIGYRVSKDDAIDLPPTMDTIRYCYLEPASRKMYKEMEKDRLIKFLGGSDADAPIVLTALLRMQQITGGFLKREDESYVQTGREKLNALKEVLEEYPKNKKIVIFAKFTPEIKAIQEVVKESGRSVEELSGKVKIAERKALRKRFQTEEDPAVLVVQIAAGGVGIDLFAADTAIFYSHEHSFGKTIQAKGRLDRYGQKGDKVTFIHLLAKDTIDEIIYQALQEKRDLFSLVVDKFLTEKEVQGMAKNHSKKQKVVQRRTPVTEVEEQEMVKRLKKLKDQVEKDEGSGKEMPKKKKEKDVVVEKKNKKKEVSDEGLITVKDLASELGVTPTALRKALRTSGLEKPGGRWEWSEDHEDLDTIRAMFAGDEEEEEKPKAKKSRKKAKPEPEPEPEEEEEDEDEDEEDEDEEDEDWDEDDLEDEEEDEEDEEEIDYSELSKSQLKTLCQEREIELPKKAKPGEMIEALVEWDNEFLE